MHHRIALLTLPLLYTSLIYARSYNVTIDDQMGDPTSGQSINYTPAGAWQDGQECERCTAKPSPPSNAYSGTWKDVSFFPADASSDFAGQIISATVPFIGTAVYVNCILTGSADNPDGNTDMTFKIDNVTVGTFQQAPNNDRTYRFGVTVFSTTGLENTVHTITLESGHAGKKALVLLDFIIYTKEVDDPTSSRLGLPSIAYTQTSSRSAASASTSAFTANTSSTNTAAIAGSVVGGIVGISAILAITFLCYRRQRRPQSRVRVVLDTSDVPSPMPPYAHYSSHPNSPNRPYPEDRSIRFITYSPPSVPTIAPGDSVSQANSDHTSDWTSSSGNGGRRTFRERARAFAASRGRKSAPPMKVQNVTDADLQESDVYDEMKLPAYMPSKLGNFVDKGKS